MADSQVRGPRPKRFRDFLRSGQTGLWVGIAIFLGAHLWFTRTNESLRPAIDEMPPPPSPLALRAMAFGDDQFLFRYLAFWLQDVGDGGGRVRPLRFYDYDRVVAWMRAITSLDLGRSDYVHQLAAHYFGDITPAVDPDGTRVRKIVDYLRGVALADPARYWQWMIWCADRARSDLKDKILAEGLARDLQSDAFRNPRVPAFVRFLSVRLYQFAGDRKAADAALANLSASDKAAIQADMAALSKAVAEQRARTQAGAKK